MENVTCEAISQYGGCEGSGDLAMGFCGVMEMEGLEFCGEEEGSSGLLPALRASRPWLGCYGTDEGEWLVELRL